MNSACFGQTWRWLKSRLTPDPVLYLSVPLQGLRGWSLSHHALLEKKGSRSTLELWARNSRDPRVTCLMRSRFHVYIHIFGLGREKPSLQLQTNQSRSSKGRHLGSCICSHDLITGWINTLSGLKLMGTAANASR